MGVVFRGYSNLKPLSDEITDEELEADDYIYLSHPAYDNHCSLGAFKDGAYKYDEEREGPRRSYSGYNEWRAELCRKFLGVEPSYVWNNREEMAGKPFIELIDFSDCEGSICYPVTVKLYRDFCVNQELASQDEEFYLDYKLFMEIFELAQQNGVVQLS